MRRKNHAKAAPAAKKPLIKTELLTNIAATTDVPKKHVAAVLEVAPAAFKRGNKEIVQALLKNGADTNARRVDGKTP